MNRRVRLLAFLAAGAVVAAVVVVLLWPHAEQSTPPGAPAKAAPQRSSPSDAASPQPHQAADDGRPAGLDRDLYGEDRTPPRRLRVEQPRVEATARGFVRALLALEVGDRSARARRGLRRHATPALVRFLAAERPRLPAGMDPPPRGELAALEGEFDRPPTAYRARVVVDRAGELSALGLQLRKKRRRWTVVDLTE